MSVVNDYRYNLLDEMYTILCNPPGIPSEFNFKQI